MHCDPKTFRKDNPEWLIHYLKTTALDNNWGLDGKCFRERLRGGCPLLVDGLDEVPDATRRKAVARLMGRASRTYQKTRMVATSRPPAYGGATVIDGFETVQIEDFDDKAVVTFVGKWCGALYSPEAIETHTRNLLNQIRSKPRIRRIAVNP